MKTGQPHGHTPGAVRFTPANLPVLTVLSADRSPI